MTIVTRTNLKKMLSRFKTHLMLGGRRTLALAQKRYRALEQYNFFYFE